MLTLAQAALVALLVTADSGYDTVFLQNGGRLRGTVVEETPATGVTIQIPGGQLRTVPPAEIFRIEYRDGSLGLLGATLTPPPAPVPPSTPAASPSPPSTSASAPAPTSSPTQAAGGLAAPPPAELSPAPATPPAFPPAALDPEPAPASPPGPFGFAPGRWLFAFGLGVASPTGEAEPGLPMEDLHLTQVLIQTEAGLRFTPRVMGSLVLDLGFGETATALRAQCRFDGGTDCSSLTARFGVQLRYAFTPFEPSTPWISVGTGFESSAVGYDSADSSDYLAYTGWEYLRLGAGIDFRSTPSIGWGLFLGAGFGRYDEVDEGAGDFALPRTAVHGWLQAGVRVILFP